MKDIVIILGIIIGILLIKTGNRSKMDKLRIIGILVIAICLIVVAPDAVRGFIDGVNSAI